MKLKQLILVSVGLVWSVAFATDWHWSPTEKDSANHWLWTNSNNWTNSAGQRGVGYPNTGDKVFLGQYKKPSATEAYGPNGSSRFFHTIQIGPVAAVSINQGGYGLQGGGGGLQYLANADCKGNWSSIYFSGDGEVPINIGHNVTYSMQSQMHVVSGNPVILKQGPGLFNCFNEGGSKYSLPEVRIQQGTWNMANKSLTITNTKIVFDGNDTSTRLKYSYVDKWHNDLLLKDSAILETNGVANTDHGIISDYDHQVHFTGTPKVNPMVFSGQFYTKAGLNWEPSAVDKVFVCSNAVSATTGKILVKKGAVKLVTGASFTALGELSIAADAVFQVDEGAGAGFKTAQLTMNGTTPLTLGNGVTLTATAALLNGVALPPGTYAAEASGDVKRATWLVGEGQVVVETGPAASDTWSGAGANTDVTTDANWSLGTAPDVTTGELLATFASGGTGSNLPAGTAAAFNGITLDNTSAGNAFAFTAGEGATAAIGQNGIVASSAAATTWTMGWPLSVGEAETWTIGANDTLSINAGLSGAGNMLFDGTGTVVFNSPSTHTGALELQVGKARVLATDGLGGANRAVTVQRDKTDLSFGGNITISVPLTVSYLTSSSASKGFSIEQNANVTFKGKVTQYEDHTLNVASGATVTFSNGYAAVNTGMNGRLNARGSGTIVVMNSPMQLSFQIVGATSNPVAFDFRTTGNNFKEARDYNWSLFTGPIYTRVANVFADRQWIQLRGTSAVFDLCGNNQSVMLFHGESGTRVTSVTPATLTVTSETMSQYQDNTNAGDTNRIDLAVFEGAVSFKKTGPVIHTFGATSTSTGTVSVTQGPLVFNANGKWPNCMSVSATSTGRLVLRNSEAFNEKATLSVATTAQLQLDGCTNKFDRLYVDGHRKGGGTYGAVGNGAAHEVNWITGTGLLDVAEHGLILFLR